MPHNVRSPLPGKARNAETRFNKAIATKELMHTTTANTQAFYFLFFTFNCKLSICIHVGKCNTHFACTSLLLWKHKYIRMYKYIYIIDYILICICMYMVYCFSILKCKHIIH